ncbi:hypothetical protein FHW96_000261 [Novosphingobium sp. SG751A]|uniref:hypothetical protein n=1 Tax=Novosphingobium sp. SG751A TaxID=2587000 RepID=UPI0015547C04|nr:hypothetical protein [Novosphingobium sp. SG751A]NOW44134.1 hypothetical protein [Novosphingobium sp. SG751A]
MMGKHHAFTLPHIEGSAYNAPTYRGWALDGAGLVGWSAFNGDYEEQLWALTKPALLGLIDAYEAELDAAMVDAQAHLAAMPAARRAQLEREWAA